MKLLIAIVALGSLSGCVSTQPYQATFEAVIFEWPERSDTALVDPPTGETFILNLQQDRLWEDYIGPRLTDVSLAEAREQFSVTRTATRRHGHELILELEMSAPTEAAFDAIRDGLFSYLRDRSKIGRQLAISFLKEQLTQIQDPNLAQITEARLREAEKVESPIRVLVPKRRPN